jgi:hypothetical protein
MKKSIGSNAHQDNPHNPISYIAKQGGIGKHVRAVSMRDIIHFTNDLLTPKSMHGDHLRPLGNPM